MNYLMPNQINLYSSIDVNAYVLRRKFKYLSIQNCMDESLSFNIHKWNEKWSDDKREFIGISSETNLPIHLKSQENYRYAFEDHECCRIDGLENFGIDLNITGDECVLKIYHLQPLGIISKKLLSDSYDFEKSAKDSSFPYPLMEWFRDDQLMDITQSSSSQNGIHLFYSKLQECYNQFQNRRPKNDKFQIPKTVHYVWLSDCFSEFNIRIPQNFKRPHNSHIECFHSNMSLLSAEKGWKHVIWTNIPSENKALIRVFRNVMRIDDSVELKFWEDTQQFSSNALLKALNQIRNYAMASDILRYQILFKKGGVYCDFDFNFLVEPDYVLQNTHFFAGLDRARSIAPTNAVMGAKRYHPIFKKCKDIIESYFSNHWADIVAQHQENAVKATLNFTGPFLLAKAFYQGADILTDVLCPPYSFSWDYFVRENPNRVYDWGQLHDLAIGRHVQSESWFTKK
ncbi:MAG: hypothetical protein C0432_03500 [Candidatus Puniceispirillum sp.]|nr:hypothetical protein [Candidatus Pelagibacter sp.]MBA4283340.1 hypothetical protein [Candidatus Puniceispirillum sp.]